jgi:hypothetical protein
MRERKLKGGVNWQGALTMRGVKQSAVKQGLGVTITSPSAPLYRPKLFVGYY